MKRLAMFSVVLLLSACAQVGLLPRDFSEKLVIAKSTVTQVTTTSTALLNARVISSSDGDAVLRAVDGAAAGIAVAQTLAAQDPAAAQARLTATMTVLEAMRAYLASRQALPKP